MRERPSSHVPESETPREADRFDESGLSAYISRATDSCLELARRAINDPSFSPGFRTLLENLRATVEKHAEPRPEARMDEEPVPDDTQDADESADEDRSREARDDEESDEGFDPYDEDEWIDDDDVEREGYPERLKDARILPSRQEIFDAFPMIGFEVSKEWSAFINNREFPQFEILTEEYLDDLATYLLSRLPESTTGDPLKIVEVGAGNGRLAHFLKERLDRLAPGTFEVIATDSGEWEIPPTFPVEKMDAEEAVQRLRPDIVIQSWMPHLEDTSATFRKGPTVREYLLIGEVNGCCGDHELTWGSGLDVPPYEADGFEETRLEDVSKNQICRTDITANRRPPAGRSSSMTMSYRRNAE